MTYLSGGVRGGGGTEQLLEQFVSGADMEVGTFLHSPDIVDIGTGETFLPL